MFDSIVAYLTENQDTQLQEIRLTNYDEETVNIFEKEFLKRYKIEPEVEKVKSPEQSVSVEPIEKIEKKEEPGIEQETEKTSIDNSPDLMSFD